MHGHLLQILYLLRSMFEKNSELNIGTLIHIVRKLGQLKLPPNNVVRKTYLEILLEILLRYFHQSPFFFYKEKHFSFETIFIFSFTLSIDSNRMQPIDSQLFDVLVEIRNEFVDHFVQSNQYGQLTQSYVQKPFTIFNLLVSSICFGDAENMANDVRTIPVIVSNTQDEVIETQLNIQYLLLNGSKLHELNASHEYSRYEIELVRSFGQNDKYCSNAMKLLPASRELYYIIDHPQQFYPFGVIKAYEILSMLISFDGEFKSTSFDFKKLTIDQLERVIEATPQEDGVDKVVEAMWKYVTAHLNRCEISQSSIPAEQIANMINHLRSITCSYRSSDLRSTAIEVVAIIIKYFMETPDLTLLNEFAELLLSLLRDDDVYVRNRTSEIVMDLVRSNANQTQFEKGKFRVDVLFYLVCANLYVLPHFSHSIGC